MSTKRSTDSGIVKEIEGSKKLVTVMFTDIEGSTKLWENHGDVRGRLMVDRHNRLLFPVVKKYGGRVIKTIGDSILATYKKPGDAVLAAIAMQQVLEQERNKDTNFPIKIRIGIHTGKGLVLLVLLIYLYRLRFVSIKILRFFKGLSAAALVWMIYLAGIQFSGFQLENKWNEPLYVSKHLFVEVLENEAPIRSETDENSKTLLKASKGDLLLLNDVAEKGSITWNRVLIGPNQYGWIERVVPTRTGVPELRITYTDKYYFPFYDLYGFLLMLPVFIWGYFNFRLKPV